MGTSARVKSQSQSATQTTTLVPGITQPAGLAPIDVLSRYPRLANLLDTFAPASRLLDRFISPLWLPLALIGCILCILVYANPQWRRSFRTRSGILINAFGSASLSIYMIFLSAAHLTSSLLVILIDLDNAWDTGLLALNQLACPLVHSLFTWSRLANLILTLAVGLEALAILCQMNHISYHKYFRHLTANGKPRKAIKICVGVLIVTFIYGLIEIAYWRVQYYYLEPDSGSQTNHMSSVPLARCEVAGGLQYWFSFKPISKFDRLLGTDRTDRISMLAASYSDYQWISGILVDCSLALANISMALLVIKMTLIRDTLLVSSRTFGQHAKSRSKINDLEVNHLIALGLIQGMMRLPIALLNMLDPLIRPGELALTDSELLVDATWQRFFTMSTVRSVAFELSELPAAFLLPVCITFSKQFRSDLNLLFCQIRETSATSPKRSLITSHSQSHFDTRPSGQTYEKPHQSETSLPRSYLTNQNLCTDSDTDDKTYETTRSPWMTSRLVQPLIPDSPKSFDLIQNPHGAHLLGCSLDRTGQEHVESRPTFRNPLHQSHIYLPRYEPKSHWKQPQKSVSTSNLLFTQQQQQQQQQHRDGSQTRFDGFQGVCSEHRSYV